MKRNRLNLVICPGFVLVGALLVGTGHVWVGVMSILFFGVGGLALLAPALSRRGPGTVETVDVDHETGFLFPISRLKQGLIVVAAFGVTAASAVIAARGSTLVGGLGVVVFGAFLVIGLLGLRGRRGLILTPTRIVAAFNGHAELDWEDLRDVTIVDYMRTRILAIDATEPARVRRTRGSRLARLNRSLLPVDIALPADNFVGEPERIVALIAAYREDERRRALIGRPEEHAQLR